MVWGLGISDSGLGFRIQGSGFGLRIGFRLGFMVRFRRCLPSSSSSSSSPLCPLPPAPLPQGLLPFSHSFLVGGRLCLWRVQEHIHTYTHTLIHSYTHAHLCLWRVQEHIHTYTHTLIHSCTHLSQESRGCCNGYREVRSPI